MVKAIIENSSAAAGISELMVQKELELGTLRSIRVSHRYFRFIPSLSRIYAPFFKNKTPSALSTPHLSSFRADVVI